MKIRNWMGVALLAVSVGACTAEVKDKGALPDVDVSGGRAPDVDVDPANVEVTTDTQTIVTPEVNVTPANGSN
ncbi:MAG TPA: hypothetical protein VE913_06265 [Longimicrobium sp.]|nr:hypothetical protein [Longimicrobium sp.]